MRAEEPPEPPGRAFSRTLGEDVVVHGHQHGLGHVEPRLADKPSAQTAFAGERMRVQ